ncbi:MAG: hypothetical protein V5A43_06995 [Haloarculaceae archaeon]
MVAILLIGVLVAFLTGLVSVVVAASSVPTSIATDQHPVAGVCPSSNMPEGCPDTCLELPIATAQGSPLLGVPAAEYRPDWSGSVPRPPHPEEGLLRGPAGEESQLTLGEDPATTVTVLPRVDAVSGGRTPIVPPDW